MPGRRSGSVPLQNKPSPAPAEAKLGLQRLPSAGSQKPRFQERPRGSNGSRWQSMPIFPPFVNRHAPSFRSFHAMAYPSLARAQLDGGRLADPRQILDEASHEGRPARLVACAQPFSLVAVEVLVKEDEVLPVRVLLEPGLVAMARAAALLVPKKDPRKTRGDLDGHVSEVHFPSGPRRALDDERISIEMVVALEGFNQEVVHGEPDGAAPVGVSTKEGRVRFRGH